VNATVSDPPTRMDPAAAGRDIAGPVLAVSGLATWFHTGGGWRQVLRDVSFHIDAQETLAIVGESGSGKSVTALSIMRLLSRRTGRVEGRIALEGRDLLSLPEKAMEKIRGNDIAMIFQEPMTSLNPVLTIGKQIAELLVLHQGLSRAAAEAKVLELLDRVRIPEARSRIHDYPHQFSGGMRQRVMIAMALACRPKLLIADEPTTALDVTIQAQILALIKQLQDEEHMSVLFITHDMGVVAEIADRVVVMYQGEAVETGSTGDIFARPEHPYTRRLLAAVPQVGAMDGRDLPLRFPTVDLKTGLTRAPKETKDTVMRGGEPLLRVQDLTVRFDVRSKAGRAGRVHAVENVSFDLQAGETLALVGESGCGKSTTGRAVLRLNEPTSGSVKLQGRDIVGLDRRAMRPLRRRMQMIFQDPFASLDPRMKVGMTIGEPLVVHGIIGRSEIRERVATLLEQVGLEPDMASRYPHEFSGGQRQRLCIARALALEPGLIVADEAVSALDVSVKAQVLNLMLDLQERMNLAYLFISHDMAVVERVSHRVAVMYLGEIVEIGPRARIFSEPQHPYTKRLLSAVTIPDPTRRRRRPLMTEEIKSPIRPLDYVPPLREYREVSPGHLVQAWGEEWEDIPQARRAG